MSEGCMRFASIATQVIWAERDGGRKKGNVVLLRRVPTVRGFGFSYMWSIPLPHLPCTSTRMLYQWLETLDVSYSSFFDDWNMLDVRKVISDPARFVVSRQVLVFTECAARVVGQIRICPEAPIISANVHFLEATARKPLPRWLSVCRGYGSGLGLVSRSVKFNFVSAWIRRTRVKPTPTTIVRTTASLNLFADRTWKFYE